MMQKKICFVLMPFKEEYRQVYDVVIKPTVESMGMNCIRADDLNTQKNIMKELVEYIHKAEIIIADLTDMNPNVFYELGISHSLGKKTIMITQSIDKFIPFDLRAYRAISYELDFIINEDEAYAWSYIYTVDQEKSIISQIPADLNVSSMFRYVMPNIGASIKLCDRAGIERRQGPVDFEDYVVVTSANAALLIHKIIPTSTLVVTNFFILNPIFL